MDRRLTAQERADLTYNRYYSKFSDFAEGILKFFENIELHKNTMLSRITDNFQRLVFT
ncbi:MAG: hypothetical protein K0U37_07555 [Gammaproteobacteria bacterium]|nr:hypothetical protein [Gammaproteobacteria bacterium]